MLLAVIRHGLCLALDRYNNTVKRRDPQFAFVLGDCVVAFFEVRAPIKDDRVRHFTLGNVRHTASRPDLRHFTGNKAVARYRHVGLCQRGAVVDLLSVGRGQRHRARVDRQRTRIRHRNDIFLRRVNLANSTFRKRCRICSGIRSRRARCGKAFKGNAFRRTGKAGNSLLRSIISLLVAVRRQLNVLMIVEIDLVRSRPNRNRLRSSRYRRVALGSDGGFRHLFPEHLACNGLGIRNLSGRPVPVVIHRVAQVGLLLKLRRERRVLIQLIIPIIFTVQFFLSLCRVKNGVVPYLIGSLVPANEIITGFRRGCHSRQRFACQLAHSLLCDSIKCSVSVRRIVNVNGLFFVRLIVHVDDRLPIHSNCFRVIFSYIDVTGNRLSIRCDTLCLRTRLTGTCIIVNKLFARQINIVNLIIGFNVFCIYLTIQMPRIRLTLIKRKVSCAILQFEARICSVIPCHFL